MPGAKRSGTSASAPGGPGAGCTWRHGDDPLPGLGDQSAVRRYDGGTLRNVELWTRRGNLLVKVDRWHGAVPIAAMRDDAEKTARTVLAAYR